MSGPHRNEDKVNTIGIVVVGICGAVLVYVSITALQAFYVNDTSEIQVMADYGGQDTSSKSVRADQLNHIAEYGANAAGGGTQTYHVKIDRAMQLVVDQAKVDPGSLVPAVGRSDKSTIDPVFGRPKIQQPAPGTAPANPGAGNNGATPPAMQPGQNAGSAGAAPAPGQSSPTPAAAGSGASTPSSPEAPMVPTGGGPTGGGPGNQAPVSGAGPLPSTQTPEKRTSPKGTGSGGHAP